MSNWKIEQSNFVVLRTPFLSEDTVDSIHDKSINLEILESIKKSLRELKAICCRKEIIKAIEFASTSLAEKVDLLTDDLSVDNLKLASSFYKYLTRMSTRCTPFGAFSSVMTLPVADRTNINLSSSMRKYIRLDSGCVIEIAKLIETKTINSRNKNLLVRRNSSLYRLSDEFRLVVKTFTDNQYIEFNLDSAKYSEAIDLALSLSQSWIQIDNLVAKLQNIYPDAKNVQLSDFVFQLLQSQLIESNITVVVSSSNSLVELNKRAKYSDICPEITNILDEVLHDFSEANNASAKELDVHLTQAKENIIKLIPDYDLNKWLHLDCFRDAGIQTYGNDKIKPIIKSINKLADLLWQPNHELMTFTRKFEERYEEASVPLLEALDADTGITFGLMRGGRSPLLEGLIPNGEPEIFKIDWNRYDEYLLNSTIEAIINKEKIVTLDIDKVVELIGSRTKPKVKFDHSISVLGTYIDGGDNKPLFQLQYAHGPSALMLLGRFCCGDKLLLEKSREIAKKEQNNNPEAIFAEIIHMPQGNVANISSRPAMREYEIVYGPGDSSLPCDKQINCNDLHLKVLRGRLILFSKKLNKEIRPRLASAHGPQGQNMPVYQFLHALQGVDGMFTGLTINKVLRKMPYVPEIRIGNIIVVPQKWCISKKNIDKLRLCKSIEDKIFNINTVRQSQKIARFISLYERDNFLDFDLDSNFSKISFISELIKRKGTVKLYESRKGLTDKDIQNKGKIYRNEIIIPCFMKTINKEKPLLTTAGKTLSIHEVKELSSLPGEKWKYFKLYTGEASADKLLAEKIAPIANKLVRDEHIKSWFFIRYNDPEFHLRIRFKLNDVYSSDLISSLFYNVLQDTYQQGLIHKIDEVAYRPEIRRYGGIELLPICEKLFYLNSVIVSDFVESTFLQKNKDKLRWQMCIRLVWQITLGTLDSLDVMELFFKDTAMYFDNDMNVSGYNKKKIHQNYRSSMKDVADALSNKFITTNNTYIKNEIYPQYNQCILEFKKLCINNNRKITQILHSLVHMDCNRIFLLNQRVNEWMIYHYLAKYTRTVIARKFNIGKEVLSGFGMKV
ncbi:MAG: lantibiotic dehydratase [Alcanivoracaceae bacterium]|nr:lantibiotic dehydratase [Alcanivoracaceae bacterium]